jgi:hypothetical protein
LAEEATVKKRLVSLAAVTLCALLAPPAQAKLSTDAKPVVVYASAQGGIQTHGDTSWQAGFDLGLHFWLFDGYIDYMGLGSGKSVSRAIVGVRGTLGSGWVRLVLRGGVGAIHESSGALTTPVGATTLTRTGGVVRGGAAVEARIFPGGWLGVGIDGEAYDFLGSNTFGFSNHGSNLLGIARLTYELGI